METATIALAKQIGKSIIAKANKYGKTGEGWYGPHMDAAACAIAERIPLVDIVLEVRDARVTTHSFTLTLVSSFFFKTLFKLI